jgi:hypothetical protein
MIAEEACIRNGLNRESLAFCSGENLEKYPTEYNLEIGASCNNREISTPIVAGSI